MNVSDLFLDGKTARRLYDQYAAQAPIYDYHCHLPPQVILADAVFPDISQVWLGDDHYKWRAMRYAGVPESHITGDASAREKFRAYAHTVARLAGSPLYHWTAFELHFCFGIHDDLDETSADRIFDRCNALIRERGMRPSEMFRLFDVRLVGTTDDPADDLAAHRTLAAKRAAAAANGSLTSEMPTAHKQQTATTSTLVIPTFRPDRLTNIHLPGFPRALEQIAAAANRPAITHYADLLQALEARMQFFADCGCRMTDNSLDTADLPPAEPEQADAVLRRRLAGESLSADDRAIFRSRLLTDLAVRIHQLGWVMQLHFGVLRNNNTRAFARLGADTGFDIMNDRPIAKSLLGFLDRLDQADSLPKTILYTLNAKDNLVLANLPQCFTDGQTPGRIQFGSAWWFNDTESGMAAHLNTLAEQSALPWFIGMLTDSRSFFSYPRHDYFRRILCRFIGDKVDSGAFSASEAILGELISGISHRNIARYLLGS